MTVTLQMSVEDARLVLTALGLAVRTCGTCPSGQRLRMVKESLGGAVEEAEKEMAWQQTPQKVVGVPLSERGSGV